MRKITSSQAEVLKVLEKEDLTRKELIERCGHTISSTALGCVTKDIPHSLLTLGLVRAIVVEDEPIVYQITPAGRNLITNYRFTKRKASEIPNDILDPIARKMAACRTYGMEAWTTEDLEELRSSLPEKYRKIPLEEIRRHIINRRKRGVFKEAKQNVMAEWYANYRKSKHWKRMETKMLRLYGGCSINSQHQNGLAVYHRTFVDRDGLTVIGRESPEDLVVLCSVCYKKVKGILCDVPESEPVITQDH